MSDGNLDARLKKAVTSGDTLAVRRLLKGGVSCSSTLWFNGSLLHEAVSATRPQIVRLLIDAKADVNAKQEDGRTALHVACRSGQEEVVNMLLAAGANVNATSRDGKTCLHTALWRGHESIALILIGHQADVNAPDGDGTRPLHWAAKLNLITCMERLLRAGANVNATDKVGRTALHDALLSGGHRRSFTVLLSHGADSNISPKMCGVTTMTALLRRTEYTNTAQLVDMLLCTGYQLTQTDLMYCDTLRAAYHLTSITPPSLTPSSLTPLSPDQCDTQRQVTSTLDRHRYTVHPLCVLCRLCVRRVVINCSNGRHFLHRLQRLPLPNVLIDFVSFNNEFNTEFCVQH